MTSKTDNAIITDNAPHFWQARFWHGMRFKVWWRLLIGGRFRISPARLPMIISISLMTATNSILSQLQELVYRDKIAKAAPHPAPIFILGHWRSGTTMLHELMILDERFSFPSTFQCTTPTHFLMTWDIAQQIGFLLPAKRPMDDMPVGWERPQEDEFALANLGLPSRFLELAFPNLPTKKSEIDLEQVTPLERSRWKDIFGWFLRRVSVGNTKPIVLKSPAHMARIKTLLVMFPQARFIHIVREPIEVFGSTVKLWKALQVANALQTPTFAGIETQVLDDFVTMFTAFERDKVLIPEGQLASLKYEDLVRAPEEEMAKIYQNLGLGEFERVRPKIATYFASRKDYRVGSYALSDDQRAEVEQRWGPFMVPYGYGSGGHAVRDDSNELAGAG